MKRYINTPNLKRMPMKRHKSLSLFNTLRFSAAYDCLRTMLNIFDDFYVYNYFYSKIFLIVKESFSSLLKAF